MVDYVLENVKWGDAAFGTAGGQVRWSFATHSFGGTPFEGTMDASMQEAIRHAFDVWESVVNIDFVEVAEGDAAQIRLGWAPIDGPQGVLAYCSYPEQSGSLSSAEIWFDPLESWVARKHSGAAEAYSMYAVAAHEIGHAIGLDHSPSNQTVMSAAEGPSDLMYADIEGGRFIYGAALSGATEGNDFLIATPGDDSIDGLGGIDTVYYGAYRAGVTIQKADNVLTVTGNGTDRLVNVERIEFENGTMAFDAIGIAGQAYRLYQAAFARTPDEQGVGYWVRALDTGLSMVDAASGFISSAEFATVYGSSVADPDFIGRLYQNILGRAGEADGLTFWESQLASGQSRAQVLASFSESPENITGVSAAISDGIWFV